MHCFVSSPSCVIMLLLICSSAPLVACRLSPIATASDCVYSSLALSSAVLQFFSLLSLSLSLFALVCRSTIELQFVFFFGLSRWEGRSCGLLFQWVAQLTTISNPEATTDSSGQRRSNWQIGLFDCSVNHAVNQNTMQLMINTTNYTVYQSCAVWWKL